MHLLLILLYRETLLDEVLSALLEMEITGAVVLDGTNMERILSEDVPILAGLFQITGGTGQAKTIVAPVRDRGLIEQLPLIFRDMGVDFSDPEVGRAFSLPVDFYLGPEGSQ